MSFSKIGLIPARGGSKSIPRKNIRILAGKPLIAWTIECALESTILDRVIVSTDDPEIAEIARYYGAETPFIRPMELAQDDTPDFPVGKHAIQWLEKNQNFISELIIWLRPTAPLRTPQDIQAAIDILNQSEADCLRSVSMVEQHPFWMKKFNGVYLEEVIEGADEISFPRRQLLPPIYHLNGFVDITRRNTILEKGFLFGGKMAGYIVPSERSIDIDSEEEFRKAELFLSCQKGALDV